MKDILKVMRFDFLSARPVALGAYIIIAVMCTLMGLFFAPSICAYIIAGAMIFIVPLQSIAAKSDFNKLYGILPVQRRNVARGRFMYIFFMHFLTELLEMVLALIAWSLQLYRVLPNQDSELMLLVRKSFDNPFSAFLMIILAFAVVCLVLGYLEMMGQIFGKENSMKVILITLGILSVAGIGLALLSSVKLIPALRLPNLPETLPGQFLLVAAVNVVMFGICVLFGEITANQLAKREL